MVFAALVPGGAVGVFYFGFPALHVLGLSVAGSVVLEALFRRLVHRPIQVGDGGAAVTGLLLGMNLPPAAPSWLVIVACAAIVVLGRLPLGGLGFNPVNPVLLARVVLLISFPAPMTAWTPPGALFVAASDAVTTATPLGELQREVHTAGRALVAPELSLLDAFLGRIPGSTGETSVLALALGGAFLLWRRVITWHIPASYLGSVAVLAAIATVLGPDRYPGPAFHLLTGGLALGAFFMATKPATSPVASRGMLIYGAGCGVLTWILRTYGFYPEGAGFAILLMNMCVPLIEIDARPQVPGRARVRGSDAETREGTIAGRDRCHQGGEQGDYSR